MQAASGLLVLYRAPGSLLEPLLAIAHPRACAIVTTTLSAMGLSLALWLSFQAGAFFEQRDAERRIGTLRGELGELRGILEPYKWQVEAITEQSKALAEFPQPTGESSLANALAVSQWVTQVQNIQKQGIAYKDEATQSKEATKTCFDRMETATEQFKKSSMESISGLSACVANFNKHSQEMREVEEAHRNCQKQLREMQSQHAQFNNVLEVRNNNLDVCKKELEDCKSKPTWKFF